MRPGSDRHSPYSITDSGNTAIVSRLLLMRNILSVTVHEREDRTQPGEVADGDNDWLKLIGRGKETLGQRYAPAVAKGTSINTTAVTEHTEWVESATFPGKIATFAGDKEEGAENVRRSSEDPGEMSF